MTQAVARIGDSISHGGTIATGSPDTLANSIGVARLTDQVHCSVHGTQTITSASTTASANGLGIARIGDTISCGAVITTGSSNTFCG